MPVLQERSKEDTKIYCRLVIILITKARATGDGVSTIFDYMPNHSSYILNIPVSITIVKIGPIHWSTCSPYSVMEALLVKLDILNLSRFQLPKITAPSHYTVVPKLIMVWAQASSVTDQNQEINQMWHHSLPMLSDGSTSSEVWYTQPLQIPISKITAPSYYTVVPKLIMMWAQASTLTDPNIGNLSNLTSFLAHAQRWKHF